MAESRADDAVCSERRTCSEHWCFLAGGPVCHTGKRPNDTTTSWRAFEITAPVTVIYGLIAGKVPVVVRCVSGRRDGALHAANDAFSEIYGTISFHERARH